MQWALKLGYTYVIFNLVLETNVAAKKIMESLNFSRLGKINNVAIMGHDDQERELVDGIIYGKSIENTIGNQVTGTGKPRNRNRIQIIVNLKI